MGIAGFAAEYKMLKLDRYSSFHNFKCGEIFCISPAVFNVTCLLCPRKMHLEQFSSHFALEHLTLAEKSINLKDLERKRRSKLTKGRCLDNITTKEEDPEDDPIQQDFTSKIIGVDDDVSEEDDEEDDKCVEQLLNDTGSSRLNKDVVENHENIEIDDTDEVPRKPFTRNNTKTIQADNIGDDEKEMKSVCQIKENEAIESDTLLEDNAVDSDRENTSDDEESADEHSDWADKVENSETNKNSKDELPFPCPICDRSYHTKQGLQKHNYSAHNPKKPPRIKGKPNLKHKCDECNDVFRSARQLEGHKWKHKGIFCDICGKPFSQVGSMVRHKIRHSGIKPHKCKECSKDFFTTKELKSHMVSHTGLMPYICEVCGKRCRDGGALKSHMRRHTGERPAKCHVCGKSFFCGHDLNVHAVTHTSDRPFKCDICGSTFQRKKALRVHKLIHSKDRKHVCKVCGKSFAQSGGLNSHMRSHDAAVDKSSTTESTSVYISTVLGEYVV